MSSFDPLLAQGIAAVQAGNKSAARRLLTRAVRQNPDSETAWLWLSGVLQTPQGRAFCLRNALALNPGNEAARRGLLALENAPRPPTLVAQPMPVPLPQPAPGRRPQFFGGLARRLRLRTLAIEEKPPPSTFSRVAKYTLVRLVTLGLMVIVGAFVAIVVINFGGFIDDLFQDRIAWALLGMSMGMPDVPIEEKTEILAQAEQEMIEAYHLNEPFLLRCGVWLWRALTLSWATPSEYIYTGQDAAEAWATILERLPNTLLLAGAANLLLFFATVFLALFLSRKYGSFLDRAIIALSPISSAPNWIFGVLLTLIFAAQLRILPFGGQFDAIPPETPIGYVLVVLKHMILPVTAIFLSMFFQSVYTWRTFFLLHSGEDYVELAEAQGLSPRTIERKYILRPTLPFILTSFTLMLITFWQGAMALEVFFRWPGIGALFIESIGRLARTTVISLVIIFAYLLALSVFLLDIIYAFVDPRVKVGSGGGAVGAVVRKKRPFRLWPRRQAVRAPGQGWAGNPGSKPAAYARVKMGFGDRVKRSIRNLRPTLRQIGRYPSAVVGLVIIVVLVGVSIYAVIAIPYNEAIERWRVDREALYRNPKNAQPEWVNLFRREDLPPTLVLDSRGADAPPEGGSVHKSTNVVSEDMTEVAISFVFDFPYGRLPQDLAVYYTSTYEKKIPFVSQTWLTPDGREIELESFAVPSAYTYLASTDTRLRRRHALGGEGGQPTKGLFVDPADLATAKAAAADQPAAEVEAKLVPVKGTYELRISGFVFEEDAELDAEFVLYGQVYGLAGTDHARRDLMVAMLWGAPVALAFGLLGAVFTSLLTMTISATGVWFGGWVDHLIQRITEIDMILPALPLAITIYLVYAKSVWLILGVMVVLSIFGMSLKNYRAMFLQVKESAYIEAARVYGASNRRIILRYLVPRIMPVLIPQLVILIPGYVFLEATLAYLGVSDIYLPTWGKVINDALTHSVFEGYYYWILEPVALLMLTGLAFAMVGFALDRILNPRLRRR
jgi:peptide/nickel transport system permease protein